MAAMAFIPLIKLAFPDEPDPIIGFLGPPVLLLAGAAADVVPVAPKLVMPAKGSEDATTGAGGGAGAGDVRW